MSDTDTAQWPPPPMHPSVDVLEVGRIRVVRTQDRLTLSDLTTGRSLWTGLLISFLFVPFFLGTIMLILSLMNSRAAADGTLHRFFIQEFWSHRLQFACMTVFLMAFSWFLNFTSRNYGLFVFDKQRSMFQKHGKDFYPLSEAAAIKTTKTDGVWRVHIVRTGGDRRPRWLKILTHPFRGDHTSVFWSRKQEHAEQIADAIADFTGVPLKRSKK